MPADLLQLVTSGWLFRKATLGASDSSLSSTLGSRLSAISCIEMLGTLLFHGDVAQIVPAVALTASDRQLDYRRVGSGVE